MGSQDSVPTRATVTGVPDGQSFLWMGQVHPSTGSEMNENEQSGSSPPHAKAGTGSKSTDTYTVSKLDTGTHEPYFHHQKYNLNCKINTKVLLR